MLCQKNCVKRQGRAFSSYYGVIEQTSPVNFRIRHQTTGTEHLVHAKYLRARNIQDVWADTPADSESGSNDANGVAHDYISSDFLEGRDSSASQQHYSDY